MNPSDDVPINAPASCPGTSSELAGKSNACAGCPNQSMCASGENKLTLEEREPEIIQTIKNRLCGIKHCLFVLSGKGGVGKSSVSVCLARGVSRRISSNAIDPTFYRVGVLDLDLCGPSIPCLMGCLDSQVHQSAEGWSPVYVNENLSLMSVGCLTDTDQAIIWRGPRKNAFIRDILCSVAWSEDFSNTPIDLLIIDTPPGTSDEHLSAVPYIKASGCPCSALIVTTPQEIALNDVRKEINFCKKINLPVLGIVENMVSFECPKCGMSSSLFPTTTGGAASLCALGFGDQPNKTLELLGRIPLDPRLTRCLDEGLCPFEESANFNPPIDGCSTASNCDLHAGLAVVQSYSLLIDAILIKTGLNES